MSLVPVYRNLGVTNLGKMISLLSNQSNLPRLEEAFDTIKKSIDANDEKIKGTFGIEPSGYIIVTPLHSSESDSRDHYAVDAYFRGIDAARNRVDIPVGCIHVYNTEELFPFKNPRKKCVQAYEAKTAGGGN
ncbi:hypothetical protein BDY19DRAFT_1055199 [Irpex rosettiformis]|uniref:Uncharacterized protein n=1 Tax=Irpex rosettiformis TaxID=378272 RepID=A0ACB8U9E1_9APHY|nr:hypothetical protein BDY19DRAFT_1055199 [Irpex rosettiformis]